MTAVASWAPRPSEARDRHLIWTVQGAHNSTTIMGSVHTLRSDAYPLPDIFDRSYEEAEILVFETEMDKMADPAIQARLLSLGLYPEGETMEDHLSPDAYKLLVEKLTERGFQPGQFSRFKPWFCAFSLTMLEFQRLGYNPQHGLDVYYFNRAKEDGKPFKHLEPVDAQIQLLASLDGQGQEAFLLQALQEINVLESMASQMTTAWRTGDAKGLQEVIEMGFKGFPELYNRFIVARNQNWMPRVEEILQGRQNALIIVGAGHLVGPQSLIRMIQDRGYRVTWK